MQKPFPTHAPLNRQEQKSAFENLKKQYAIETPATPLFPVAPIKEYKPSQDEQLKVLHVQYMERGLQQQTQMVEKQLEENKTATTVQQFYCRHVYQAVNAAWMGIPIRYKICNKCGIVK